MTINKTKTAQLRTALADETNFFYWLRTETSAISDTEYNIMKSDFQSWKTAYDANNLTVTNADGSTEQLSGIDQFPVPPSR